MVYSSDIKHELNLGSIYLELMSREMDVIYEPEAFPGMILKSPSCTYNLFSSGKYLILGCTSITQAEIAERSFVNNIG